MYIPAFASLLFLLTATSTTVVSAQGNSAATSAEYTSDDTFRDAVLSVTNTYRKQHNASALTWNGTLAEYAGDWGAGCGFKHSGGPYGENLASGYANVSDSIVAWGEERKSYNFGDGQFNAETGHFTQLVWKATAQVGCSRHECNAGQDGGEGDAPGWYVVCEYAPAGNVIGAFVENVQSQVSGDGTSGAGGLAARGRGVWVSVLVGLVGGWLL